MINIFKKLFLISFFILNIGFANALELYNVIPVNITSESASKAKKIAIDSAKRKAIINILSNYSNTSELHRALEESKNIENLISSISIDGEKQSSKTYSANIKISLDEKNSKSWMDKNSVQNWLNLDNPDEKTDKIQVVINLKNALYDWIDFNKQLYFSGINFNIENIHGNIVSGKISKSKKQSLLSLRNSGWNLTDTDNSIIVKKW